MGACSLSTKVKKFGLSANATEWNAYQGFYAIYAPQTGHFFTHLNAPHSFYTIIGLHYRPYRKYIAYFVGSCIALRCTLLGLSRIYAGYDIEQFSEILHILVYRVASCCVAGQSEFFLGSCL